MAKYKILVVDDEEGNINLLRRMLMKDYLVHTSKSGQEALNLLTQHSDVAVILSDQRMPGMLGTELLKNSIRTHPNSIRLILTGYTDSDDLIGAINEGEVWRYIVKPWKEDDLRHTIKQAIEKYELERENEQLITHLQEQIEREEHIRNIFQKYVPEAIVNQILSMKEEDFLQGELKESTILFCDIRGFTTYSDGKPPKEIVNMLNEYFTSMSKIIQEHGGIIDKFIGDAVMAVWGAPHTTSKDSCNAVKAGIEMIKSLTELNKKWKLENDKQLKIGIGINTGEVIAGNLGCASKMEYTVIGDTVNVASRIENLTKNCPNAILIGEQTYNSVKNEYKTKQWEAQQVRGKKESVNVYEVIY